MTANSNLSPPWTLIIYQDKPVSIVPSMRFGEVANVEGMKLEDAERIVQLANAEHYKVMGGKIEAIKAMHESTFARMDDFIAHFSISTDENSPIEELEIDKSVPPNKIKQAMEEAEKRTKPREMTIQDWLTPFK